MKKIFTVLILCATVFCMAFALSGCANSNDNYCDYPDCSKAEYREYEGGEYCAVHYNAVKNNNSTATKQTTEMTLVDTITTAITTISVIAGILTLVINVIIAYMMKSVAVKKGYYDGAYAFPMCFFLGIVGCLYVVALPDIALRAEIQRLNGTANK